VNQPSVQTTPVLRVSGRTWAGRLLIWPLCVAILAVHLSLGHDDYPTAARIYAGLLGCLALLCVVYAPIRVVPALAIGMSYFYAALGAPVFSRGTTFSIFGLIRLPPASLEQATLAALFFATVVVVVATAVDRASRRVAWKIARSLEGDSTYDWRHTLIARSIAVISLAVSLMIVVGVRFGSLAQPIGLLSSPLIAATFLFWDAEQTGRTSAKVAFAGFIGVQWLLGMLTGMMGTAMMPAVIAAALLWARRGHLPGSLVAAGVCVFLIFNPAKSVYRKLTWFNTELTALDRITFWGDALWYTHVDAGNGDLRDIGGSFESSLRTAASRVNTLGQVAHIFDWVPERVPHAGPDSWLMVPQLLIPRMLWPDKPIQEELFNKQYTYQFRLQSPGGRTENMTSIALPSVGDGYWRLGWPGVAIEAFFMGLVIGWAQAIGRGGVSRIASRTSLLLAVSLMQVKTDLHTFGSFNGALQQLLVALMVAWAAQRMADLLGEPDAPLAEGAARG
jgi:hypothetical protein